MTVPAGPPGASVDLYWIPLGADDRTHLVRASGRAYEYLHARRRHRAPRPLFHSALLVGLGPRSYAIEMAPAWGAPGTDRGVTGTGAVGLAPLGRWRLFRYEVRCWEGGRIPDLAAAVGGPCRLGTDPARTGRLLGLVPRFPTLVWGRDELGTGDMWNSNSLVAWLLAGSDHDLAGVRPPDGGRAPGWQAGLQAATCRP